MTRVFCYGSLKKGFGNHSLLTEATYVGRALTEGRFTMLHLGGFPGIVQQGDTSIHGELYDVDAALLYRLDRLEGHPNFYIRTPISVLPTTDSLDEAAWESVEAYVLPDSWFETHSKIVDGGDW